MKGRWVEEVRSTMRCRGAKEGGGEVMRKELTVYRCYRESSLYYLPVQIIQGLYR
jgi:hypothetical protein